MRNKQAKALRQQARQSAAAEQTTYTMEVYNKTYFDPLTGKLKGYKVVTASMDLCQRSVYQSLKKEFKSNKA
jgi:DNA/RNA endonuclease YhcR with UshA esterase domain